MSLSRRQFAATPLALGLGGLSPLMSAALAQDGVVPSLGAAFAAARMPFGAAVTPMQLADPKLAAHIAHHFRILVAENAMKPMHLSPREGEYTFGGGDAIADFAAKHRMPLRGHTLVWHQQAAAWMFKDGAADVSRAKLIARMERYIADVVGHFKGRVFAWDVVNEAIVYDEPEHATDANGYRLSPWRNIIGPEFIEIAFRAASKADPDALLFYNDYETQNPKKAAAILQLVKDLKARGVKIDGVGHQMHCARVQPSLAEVEASIDALATTGVIQHVTELDFAINDRLQGTAVTAVTPELLADQAERYRSLMDLLMRKRLVSATLVWGISDAHSWLNGWPKPRVEAPLMFDRQLAPKPAYHALMDVARKYAA